jgi:hypothetical protein
MGKYKDAINFVDHDFATTTVLINGETVIQGLHSLEVEYDENETEVFMVDDGTGQFVASQGRSGTIRIGLLEASPSTDEIEDLREAGSQFSISATDANAPKLKVVGQYCKCEKPPVIVRGKTPVVPVWTFKVVYLTGRSGSYKQATV